MKYSIVTGTVTSLGALGNPARNISLDNENMTASDFTSTALGSKYNKSILFRVADAPFGETE